MSCCRTCKSPARPLNFGGIPCGPFRESTALLRGDEKSERWSMESHLSPRLQSFLLLSQLCLFLCLLASCDLALVESGQEGSGVGWSRAPWKREATHLLASSSNTISFIWACLARFLAAIAEWDLVRRATFMVKG